MLPSSLAPKVGVGGGPARPPITQSKGRNMSDQIKPPAPTFGVSEEQFLTRLYNEARRCGIPVGWNAFTQLLNLPCPDCGSRQIEANWFVETELKTRCMGCRRLRSWPIDKGSSPPNRNT